MPVPSSLNDLSTTPAMNSPAGSESPALVDDYLRTHAAFLRQLSDGKLNDSATTAFSKTVLAAASAAAARTILDAPSRTGADASGTWGISVSGNAATATTAANANALNGQPAAFYQQALGFTPVQQAGGTSMNTNKVYIGWDGPSEGLRAQIDAFKVGFMVTNRSGIDTNASSALFAPGVAPMYACRAWVNFNGTGTVAVRASGNVSSITDNGAGDYSVNFTTAMPDGNYAVVAGGGNASVFGFEPSAISGAAARIIVRNTSNGTTQDVASVMVAVFR